ncbi:carbohydrate ABC transporter permease [Kribbella ginsengisoli]|uniref:Carbohydrate ABC transporter permease n=1 Tax=Kribbella ginsengisoli TaxID=363865 RepID=A0ABP6Z9Y5_9ACTN
MISKQNCLREARARSSRRPRGIVTQLTLLAVLSLGAMAMILPFVWMIATSLSRQANISMPRDPSFWPPDPSLFNYRVASANLPVARLYLNSIIVAGGSTIGYLLFSSMTGYAFAKGRFRGKSVLFIAFLSTLLIPFETRMIPLYLLMKKLALTDTLAALIVPFLVGGFGTFLLRQHITTIPDDLIDAARIDGAGEFRIFWTIILPLCKSALAALAIVNVIWRWNDVLWPLLVITTRENQTLTQGLAAAGRASGVFPGVALATAVLAVGPVIIAYLILQRHIIRGVATSGLKG